VLEQYPQQGQPQPPQGQHQFIAYNLDNLPPESNGMGGHNGGGADGNGRNGGGRQSRAESKSLGEMGKSYALTVRVNDCAADQIGVPAIHLSPRAPLCKWHRPTFNPSAPSRRPRE